MNISRQLPVEHFNAGNSNNSNCFEKRAKKDSIESDQKPFGLTSIFIINIETSAAIVVNSYCRFQRRGKCEFSNLLESICETCCKTHTTPLRKGVGGYF